MPGHAGPPSPRLSAPIFAICGSLPAFLTYVALTLLLFSPLLPHLGASLHDRSDTTLNTWIVAWQAHILPRAPWTLFDAPIFHPLPNALALSEILWPIAPLAVPLLAAADNPVLVYNLFFLAAFPLAGLGAYLLALRMTGQRLASFLAGLIYAFSPHQFGHLSQLQLLSIAWLPLTLLFLDRFWTHSRPRDGCIFALCAAFQTLSAFYYGFQVALAVGLYLGARVVVSCQLSVVSCQLSVVSRQPSATHPTSYILHRTSYIAHRLIALLPWIALAALLIAPFAAPYLRVRGELGLERSIGETLRNAATLAEWVRPPPTNPLYRALPGVASAEGGLFPGIVVLGLAALGVLIRRGRPKTGLRRSFWFLLALTAVILSLGPQLKLTAADSGGLALPFGWLYEHVPGMTAIRAPGRFANSAFLALAMLAAMGARAVVTQSARFRRGDGQAGTLAVRVVRTIVTAALALLILAEYAGGLGRFAAQPMPPVNAPFYAWLADQPAAAIIELPLTSEIAAPPAHLARAATGLAPGEATAAAWPDHNLLRYQYFQTSHWQPTADGYSGFVPPHHRELGLTLAHFPDARSLALLSGLGVERVIVHSAVMEAFAPGRAAALRDALATRGMSGVRLEREFGPEWVYRLPQASPNTGPVAGRFWSTADGQAFLLLAAPGGREILIPPGSPLRVQGAWAAAGGAAAQSFEVTVRLPLLVGAGSVIPLDLPRPPAGGAQRLRVAADDARVAAPPFEQAVAVTAAMNETELLAIQAAAGEITSGQTPLLAMTFSTGQETAELAVAGGQTVTVTLPWRLLDRPARDYSISARLLDAAGQMVAQDDRALSDGRDLVRGWQGAATITTTHTLRVPPAAGRPFDGAQDKYRFEAFFYRPDDPTDILFLDAAGNPAATLTLSWRIGPAGQ
jgi:hypothetical protein